MYRNALCLPACALTLWTTEGSVWQSPAALPGNWILNSHCSVFCEFEKSKYFCGSNTCLTSLQTSSLPLAAVFVPLCFYSPSPFFHYLSTEGKNWLDFISLLSRLVANSQSARISWPAVVCFQQPAQLSMTTRLQAFSIPLSRKSNALQDTEGIHHWDPPPEPPDNTHTVLHTNGIVCSCVSPLLITLCLFWFILLLLSLLLSCTQSHLNATWCKHCCDTDRSIYLLCFCQMMPWKFGTACVCR